MVTVDFFKGETVIVFGLGKTGWSVAKSLTAGGANVIAWDDNFDKRTAQVVKGVTLLDPLLYHWQDVRAVILSPGIPYKFPAPHSILLQAKQHRVPIYSDIDLYLRACPQILTVGITGTNGKSTTTALVTHILNENGKHAQMGGNIGQPVLSLEAGSDGTITVLELSSYQLDLTKFQALDVAILLNISPDHLKRHGSMDNYVKTKQSIFRNQRIGQKAVVGVDDICSERAYQILQTHSFAHVVPISSKRVVKGGVSVLNKVIYDNATDEREIIIDLSSIPDISRHNGQNIAAAYVAARHLGVSREHFLAGLSTFTNLPHRQELVSIVDNVRYINDSKATNCEAAEQALKAYDDIFWILGGRPKEAPIETLVPYMQNVKHAFLIGEAQTKYTSVLKQHVPVSLPNTLEEAVSQARLLAVSSAIQNPVVLLSPACESFDMYNNFEERGDHFKELVYNLPGVHIKQNSRDS